jgi:predicted GNAT family acetyltransferase
MKPDVKQKPKIAATGGPDMRIVSEDKGSGGRYLGYVDGVSEPAEMTFSRASPTLIIIDHTQVPDALRGKGVGQALAEHAVEAARSGGWKLIPLCPFMKAQMDRHPEWNDVRKS